MASLARAPILIESQILQIYKSYKLWHNPEMNSSSTGDYVNTNITTTTLHRFAEISTEYGMDVIQNMLSIQSRFPWLKIVDISTSHGR